MTNCCTRRYCLIHQWVLCIHCSTETLNRTCWPTMAVSMLLSLMEEEVSWCLVGMTGGPCSGRYSGTGLVSCATGSRWTRPSQGMGSTSLLPWRLSIGMETRLQASLESCCGSYLSGPIYSAWVSTVAPAGSTVEEMMNK